MNYRKSILALFLLLAVVAMTVITVPYFSFRYDIGYLLTKQLILHNKIWRAAFYMHISSSLFVLLAGAIQFIITGSPKTHRRLGVIYVVTILLFSAPSGFVMALYANGGLASKVAFVTLSGVWWIFTYKAYVEARKKNWQDHRAYMLRSFGLTLAAITLRTYVLVLPFVIHLSAKDAYTLVAYLSWVPNLLIAEVIVRRTRWFVNVVRDLPAVQTSHL